jgi:hypothetical protein
MNSPSLVRPKPTTTKTLSGTLKTPYTLALTPSSTIFSFKLPIVGKKIPQHISKTQKHQNVIASLRMRTGIRKQHAATIRENARSAEGETTHRPGGSAEYQVKKSEPSIIAHIRAAKIMPKGRSEPLPLSWCESLNAGNLKKIQRYSDPSKKHEVMANAHRRLSAVRSMSKDIVRKGSESLTVLDNFKTTLLWPRGLGKDRVTIRTISVVFALPQGQCKGYKK